MKPMRMKLARMKTIRLTFWWKEKWKQSHGIMLITTLLILALLVGMTVGFITINRDNLMLATNAKDQEAALQAAYAGLQYVQMGFEEDGGFGTGPAPWSGNNCANPNNGNGFTEVFCSSNFYGWEGNGVAVGVLNNGNSIFEVIFNNGPNNNNNGYNLSDIAADPTAPPSTQATFPTNEVSINNLNAAGGPPPPPGGNSIPKYSARVIVLGYSHGVTRVVEAMFEQKSYVDSSAQAAAAISVKSGCSGNSWTLSTNDPFYNDVKAGIAYKNGAFTNVGGNITGPSLSDISFSNAVGSTGLIGQVDALQSTDPSNQTTSGGSLTLGSTSETNPVTTSNTNTGNGTLYPNSTNIGTLPSKDLHASDILNQIYKQQSDSASPATYYMPAGIYAFVSDNGKGDEVNVYDFSGNLIGTFQKQIKVGNVVVANINNYQFQVSPGINLAVDSNISSATINTSGTASGNFMLTLDPSEFNTNTGAAYGYDNWDPNYGPHGGAVLPTLAMDYQGPNQLGPQPSSLDVPGNMYVQGQLVGSGALLTPSGASAPSTWVPTSGAWGSATPSGATPWSSIVQGNDTTPSSGTSGDISVEGNSELSAAPNQSIAIYADNNAYFNPISAYTSNQVTGPLLGEAYTNALNDLASTYDTGSSHNNAGGGWQQNLTYDQFNNNVLSSSNTDNIDQLDNYPYGNGTSYQNDTARMLRRTFYGNTTPITGSGLLVTGTQCVTTADCGAENMNTGVTASQIFGSSTVTGQQASDLAANASTLLTNNNGEPIGTYNPYYCPGTSCTVTFNSNPVNLYTYTQLSEYLATGSSTVLSYQIPGAASQNSLDPIEGAIVSNMNTLSQQAQQQNSDFGVYMYNTFPNTICTSNGGTGCGGSGTTTKYTAQDMTFTGLIYVKGSKGFEANTGCNQFSSTGSIITTTGNVNIPDSSQVSFIYDPSQLVDYVPRPYPGVSTKILWMTVW